MTTPEQQQAVDEYVKYVKGRTERERMIDHTVTGVFSGAYGVNPITGDRCPIYISEYVLAGYGTGAIMAVPAHDSRDYAFAKHFSLPIIPLIEGADVSEESYDAKEGIVMNSPMEGKEAYKGFSLNGKTIKEAKEQLAQLRLKGSELRLHLEQLEATRARENDNLLLLLDDRKQVTEEYMANRDKLKSLRATVSEREGLDAEAREQLEAMKREIAQLGSAVTALENQLQDARVVLETSAAKAALNSQRMQQLDADTLRVRKEISANQEEARKLEQTIAECKQDKEKLQRQSEEELAELQKIVSGKEEFTEQRGALLSKQGQLEQPLW